MQTMEATFSPMLVPAKAFCVDPLLSMATMARMKAGMAQKRPMKEVPQNSRTAENMRAPAAKRLCPSLGGDTVVIFAVG